MSELLTAAQMRSIEMAAIESGEVTGLELMERAGRGVVEAVFEEWPELAHAPHRAVVLCGPGNNGGDGFVVARLLKDWGWEVEVFLYGDPAKLPPDAKVNYERWAVLGEVFDLPKFLPNSADNSEVIFDALFGTGLSRAIVDLDEVFHGLIKITNDWELYGKAPRVVAIDLPSGTCADSGRELRSKENYSSASVEANLTVTFHRAKIGHYCEYGYAVCRSLCVKDIGMNNVVGKGPPERLVSLMDGGRVHRVAKHHLDHKYSHGHALILSGGAGKTGAARLAARGALRIGAGVVTLGVPPSAQMEVAGHITAVMLRRIEAASALAEVLADKRITALCLGPGMGTGERESTLIAAALESGRDMVLDADALTLISRDATLFTLVHARCVLTPHAGEFARLFPDIAEKLNAPAFSGPAYSKVDATREAAKRAGCVVLFKGPDTVIAAPDGRCSINSAQYERAAPWLATAGSGDVLAGFITGLLARGFKPMQAAETAAWLHVECALEFGPGLIAEDLPETLPAVLRALGV